MACLAFLHAGSASERQPVIYAAFKRKSYTPRNTRDKGRSQGPRGEIRGSGEYAFEIVGESHYQKALKAIAGPKTRDGKNHECTATLILEDDNPHDPKAVRVDIEGHTVGYLARDMARAYRKQVQAGTMTVPALIVGGWNAGGGDVGQYGVKLDLPIDE